MPLVFHDFFRGTAKVNQSWNVFVKFRFSPYMVVGRSITSASTVWFWFPAMATVSPEGFNDGNDPKKSVVPFEVHHFLWP